MKTDDFYKRFFKMYILLVVQNVITLSVNLADNLMLGGYSEVALSGVTAVNQIQFVYQQMLNAIGDGLVIIGSQYWGKRQIGQMKKLASIAMRAGLIIGAILFVLVSIFPHGALHIFTSDESIISEGMSYLTIIRFTYLLFAVTTILLATLRMEEIVKIAFVLSISTLCINCGINYVLIYGRFGAPELGAVGAAIGTLVARAVECIIVLFYLRHKEQNLKLRFWDYLHIDMQLTKDYIKLATPIFITQLLWGMSTALQTAILGHMTSRAIAANSVASNLFLMVKSMAVGASAAASVMIGKAIGEGDMRVVRSYSVRLQKMFVVIGVISGIVLFFLRLPVLGLYNLSDATREMANSFLIILSVICVGMSYQMPTNNGIVRSGGSAMYIVKLDIVSIWCIVLPISYIMAFVLKASPAVVVCCLNADQIFKCVPAFIKVNYGNWVKKLTR